MRSAIVHVDRYLIIHISDRHPTSYEKTEEREKREAKVRTERKEEETEVEIIYIFMHLYLELVFIKYKLIMEMFEHEIKFNIWKTR